MEILVCPLSALPALVAEVRPSHVISLLSPEAMIATPPGIAAECHLKLAVNDIAAPEPGLVPPSAEHARTIVEFAVGWDRAAPVVIHCWAGISRSTAAAFIALCAIDPSADEAELAGLVRAAAPFAAPNRLLVEHGDQVLGRAGRMGAAIEAMGPPVLAWEGRPFRLGVPANARGQLG